MVIKLNQRGVKPNYFVGDLVIFYYILHQFFWIRKGIITSYSEVYEQLTLMKIKFVVSLSESRYGLEVIKDFLSINKS